MALRICLVKECSKMTTEHAKLIKDSVLVLSVTIFRGSSVKCARSLIPVITHSVLKKMEFKIINNLLGRLQTAT